MKKLLVLLAATVILLGCNTPIEQTSRDGIATASGFLKQEVISNQASCIPDPSQSKCVAIKKAAASLTVVDDALQLYCASDAFNKGTGPCTPPTDKTVKNQLAGKLTAALQDLNRNINDIKALGGK